ATPCREGGAGPTSQTTRASFFPAEWRRTPEGVGAVLPPRLTGPGAVVVACSAAPPHDESAAETHAACADVGEPGLFPRGDGGVDREAPVVTGDAWPQEATDVEPRPPAEGGSRDREHGAGVDPPPTSPPWVRRHGELEARHRPSRTYDPRELGDGAGRIGDVAEQVGESQCIEA